MGRTLIFLALVHYPVLNRQGKKIVSAVTNLDLHDIARAAMTYGVRAYYVVTPVREQQHLVERLVRHWTHGPGATINPDRREALRLIRIKSDIEDVVTEISLEFGGLPCIYATTAKKMAGQKSWRELAREIRSQDKNILLVFGTASGLHPLVFEQADGVIEPITGKGDYNHLSVRSAVSIALDRIAGVW